MSTISLSLDEIFDLAKKTLLANGCDDETASILSDLIMKAERDGSLSHGLFRLPAYVTGLKSGKINGKGKPEIKKISPSVIKVLGNNCLAPVVLSKGIPELVKAAKENGVAVLAINNSHHMAAMWPETEMIAEQGLVAFACTSSSLLLHQRELQNHYLELIQFHLHGQDQEKLQLFMIWLQPQWRWGKCKLLKEKVIKFH